MHAKGTTSEKRSRQAEPPGSRGLCGNNNYGSEYKNVGLRRAGVKLGEARVLFAAAPHQIPLPIQALVARCF